MWTISAADTRLTKLNGGLSQLHSVDENAVSWLTSYGSWHAYKKKNTRQIEAFHILTAIRHDWIGFSRGHAAALSLVHTGDKVQLDTVKVKSVAFLLKVNCRQLIRLKSEDTEIQKHLNKIKSINYLLPHYLWSALTTSCNTPHILSPSLLILSYNMAVLSQPIVLLPSFFASGLSSFFCHAQSGSGLSSYFHHAQSGK